MDKYKWQRGFLMVDALLAIVIISVALVSIVGMFIQSTKATRCSAEYTMASNLAQQQIELLREIKLTQFVVEPGIWYTLPLDSVIKDFINSDKTVAKFKVEAEAQQCPENLANLIEVKVTVTWSDKKQNYSMPFTTFMQKT